jgi:hypothetical protein
MGSRAQLEIDHPVTNADDPQEQVAFRATLSAPRAVSFFGPCASP